MRRLKILLLLLSVFVLSIGHSAYALNQYNNAQYFGLERIQITAAYKLINGQGYGTYRETCETASNQPDFVNQGTCTFTGYADIYEITFSDAQLNGLTNYVNMDEGKTRALLSFGITLDSQSNFGHYALQSCPTAITSNWWVITDCDVSLSTNSSYITTYQYVVSLAAQNVGDYNLRTGFTLKFGSGFHQPLAALPSDLSSVIITRGVLGTYSDYFYSDIYEALKTMRDSLIKIQNSAKSIDDAIGDVVKKGEEAEEQAKQDADKSQSDAESTGQSLLSVFTGFVGAVSSASPSSCVISGNLGFHGLDLGNLDFCSFPVPSYVSIIGTFLLVALLVPLSLHLGNTVVRLIRSFQ